MNVEEELNNLFYSFYEHLINLKDPSEQQVTEMLVELRGILEILRDLKNTREIREFLTGKSNAFVSNSNANQVFYNVEDVPVPCPEGLELKEKILEALEDYCRLYFTEVRVEGLTLLAQKKAESKLDQALKLLHELNKCREPHKSNCYPNYSDSKKTGCSFDGPIEDGFKEYCAKISSSEYENYYVYKGANLEKLYELLEKSIKGWVIPEHSTTYPLVESNFVGTWGLVSIGLILIMFGLYIKLALAPAHLWSLKVYQGSPISSVFFFSVISKISVFSLLIRLFYINAAHLSEIWFYYSAVISVLSIFIGALGGFKQRRLKALLAYSSTNHMGYTLLGYWDLIQIRLNVLKLYCFISTQLI